MEYVNEKKFREDLYYRLSVFPLQWKSLRQRTQDLLPIAERLLHKHCKKQNKPTLIFDESAQQKLQQHSWPGNVRELDNVIQRALIIQTGHSITASDIVLNVDAHAPSQVAQNNPFEGLDMPISQDPVAQVNTPADGLGDNLKQREYTLILDALKHEKNKKRAAEKLGISPRTLRYKMAQMREQGIDIQSNLMF